jgi:HK97 family phage portal protein
MRIFGLTISRTKSAVEPMTAANSSLYSGRGWWPIIRESFTGAWQRGVEVSTDTALSYAAVYACVTLIAADIGKLRIKLMREQDGGIWAEEKNSAYSPVLRRPNRFQTSIKFLEQWVVSKLIHGNTYVLKQRDTRGIVSALYVLDPTRVKPLVGADGEIYYQLDTDSLSGLPASVRVAASEIIHDVMVPLFHPLCGVSPLTACGLAALQGLQIQGHSSNFFSNGANPGGILTAPERIDPEDARKLQEDWESNYGGVNAGKIAVLGGGLEYKSMGQNAVDSQLIEQLKWSAENICTAYRVPAYMVGVAPAPIQSNVEALTIQYYNQCLQNPIESIEALLDEGLGLANNLGTELDLDGLMRMDTATKVKAASESIGSGGMAPNEARQRYFNLGPVKGGETPYLQQQNYSLAALAKRDAQDDPFASKAPQSQPATVTPPAADPNAEKRFVDLLRKELFGDLVTT